MKPKHKRLIYITTLTLTALISGFYILATFKDNLVFFYMPSEVTKTLKQSQKTIRIGGLVKADSVEKKGGLQTTFTLTDHKQEVIIHYTGILPALFRPGQGIVAKGHFTKSQTFEATELLAKHDENYRPPGFEVEQ